MTTATLMIILAHPDDGSFPMGGTLAKSTAAGKHVHLVTATHGEMGIPGKNTAETAVLRETELRRACAELGVQQLTFLDYVDGTLANIPDIVGADRLLGLMRQYPPNVVVTFGPDGVSGHPDHLAVYHWTTVAFDQYQQEVERPLRLYYIALSEATQQGCGIPPSVEAVGGPVAFIDVGEFLVQKVRAAQQHQSQAPRSKATPKLRTKTWPVTNSFA